MLRGMRLVWLPQGSSVAQKRASVQPWAEKAWRRATAFAGLPSSSTMLVACAMRFARVARSAPHSWHRDSALSQAVERWREAPAVEEPRWAARLKLMLCARR